ncbi:MAG: hypothetical protein D6739_05380 [Nitrospirae bacterium]|nr:MAG: hypothetical protein D6739_05380 [Nitrospirota bacterium]
MILLHGLALAVAAAVCYPVAGGAATLACGAGLLLESANLLGTEAVAHRLLEPGRRGAELFRLLYFLKYLALIAAFAALAVASGHVLAVAAGFSTALAVHVAARARTTLKEAPHVV